MLIYCWDVFCLAVHILLNVANIRFQSELCHSPELMCSGSKIICEQMTTRTGIKSERKKLFVAFCGAMAATFVWKCMQTWSQEWCDRDVYGFTETVFIQNSMFVFASAELWRMSTYSDLKVWIWYLRLDKCSDWGCISKNIWFRNTHESRPNWNWKDQILCDCAVHACHGEKFGPPAVSMYSQS